MVQQVPWHAVSNGGGEDAPQLLLKGFKRVYKICWLLGGGLQLTEVIHEICMN